MTTKTKPNVQVYPESSVVDGKYKPGPGIWFQFFHTSKRLTLEEAKELRRKLSYIIRLVEGKIK